MGRVDVIAQCLASLIATGRTHLVVQGMHAIAQTGTAKAVRRKPSSESATLVILSLRSLYRTDASLSCVVCASSVDP